MSGLYVYGLIAGAALPSSTLPTGTLGTGIGGAAVRLLRAGALNALVSDIPPAPIARTRRDVAYAAVLERAVALADVLPLPAGATTPHPAALAARIGAQADRLTAALAGIAGRVQFTLKASWHDGIVSEEVIAADPELTGLRDRLHTLPATETSYERVELGRRVEAEMARRRGAEMAAMLAELSPLAEREAVLEPPEDDTIFNRAFLVPRAPGRLQRRAPGDDRPPRQPCHVPAGRSYAAEPFCRAPARSPDRGRLSMAPDRSRLTIDRAPLGHHH